MALIVWAVGKGLSFRCKQRSDMEEELAEHSQEAQSPQYLLKLRGEENTKEANKPPLACGHLTFGQGDIKTRETRTR